MLFSQQTNIWFRTLDSLKACMNSTAVVRNRTALTLLALLLFANHSYAQLSYEQAPINYNKASTDNPIARLQKKIDSGKVKLKYDKKFGYLPAILKALNISQSSQMLVYSKTSFQLKHISPSSPRAVYFGDDTYAGFVKGGDVVELSTVDPQKGAIFYTIDQEQQKKPKFFRHTYQCTQCHSSSLTRGVPGHVVRSIYSSPDGTPILKAGSFHTDHSSKLKERWGGWYVTGTSGKQLHMGNLLMRKNDDSDNLDLKKGSNVTTIKDRFDTSAYLSAHSDIVALMVMEHQAKMQNLITLANYEGRFAIRDAEALNELMQQPAGTYSSSIKRRFKVAGDRLLKYMLFSDETKLTSTIKGTSNFTVEFSKNSPHDSKKRSLKQFDLTTRLFKYPCSYEIYSKAFDSLPQPVLDYVYKQLWEILHSREKGNDYSHLSKEDRKAILQILQETKKGLPDYWLSKGTQKKTK